MIHCTKCQIEIFIHSDTLKEKDIKLCSKCKEAKGEKK
jgi:hypothetical protein